MSAEPMPQAANPNIEQVFHAFLAEQRARLKPATLAKYESVLSLLESHLDSYAYEDLSKAERALFERHFNAEGEQHRTFCQLFGPEKIPEQLGTFFSYFLPNKVLGGANLFRSAGTVTKKLSRWLAAKGYVSDEAAKDSVEKTSVAGRDLANAERAAMALYGSIRRLPVHPNDLPEEDWIEYDHHTIARIEPGALWLHVHVEGRGPMETGPIQVPREATELLVQGWEIGCSLARVKGQWKIVELGNIHP